MGQAVLPNEQAIIYALAEKSTPSRIRYIGKTRYPLRYRLNQHINGIKRYSCHRSSWLKSLIDEGRTPVIWQLELVTQENWQERERLWVDFFRPLGWLTNHYDGGNGCHRMPPTKESTRLKQRIAKLGYNPGRARYKKSLITKRSRPKTEGELRQLQILINSRKRKVLCVDTGEVFESMNAAARSCGISGGCKILTAIQRNGRCHGKQWQFLK